MSSIFCTFRIILLKVGEMGFSYKWISNDIIVSFEGELSFEDIMNADGIIFSNPRFDKMQYQIFDFSAITSITLSKDETKALSILDVKANIWNNKVKVASVATHPQMIQMALLYKQQLESKTKWISEIFSKIEDAQKWVDE